MHAGSKTLIIGNPLKQVRQLLAFTIAQRGAQRQLMRSSDLTNPFQRVVALRREMERVAAPVARLISSLHETSMLELVDQRDQSARRHSQFSSKRLLAQPF